MRPCAACRVRSVIVLCAHITLTGLPACAEIGAAGAAHGCLNEHMRASNAHMRASHLCSVQKTPHAGGVQRPLHACSLQHAQDEARPSTCHDDTHCMCHGLRPPRTPETAARDRTCHAGTAPKHDCLCCWPGDWVLRRVNPPTQLWQRLSRSRAASSQLTRRFRCCHCSDAAAFCCWHGQRHCCCWPCFH